MGHKTSKQVLLITGGNGMVGRNLQAHPLVAGWTVMAPSSTELNLQSKTNLRSYLAKNRPDAVIHAAGLVGGIQANMAQPVQFLAVNTEIGINVVRECVRAGVTRLINLASSCMYPKALGSGLQEDQILTGSLEPTNEGYALGKIVTMRMCEYAMRENSDLSYKTIIPCNLYGRWDKFNPKQSHLVPAIIHKVHAAKVRGQVDVEIWGDGTARREFMYAADLADAVMRGLDDITALPDKINVGLGHDYSIKEYYRTVAKVIGWNGNFVHDITKPVGMSQKLLDVSRQNAWGWRPQTSLEDGVRATYDFYLREYAQ